MVFLDKNRSMENVQKQNICIKHKGESAPSSLHSNLVAAQLVYQWVRCWAAERAGFDFWQQQGTSVFSILHQLALGPTQPPIQ
jgi:hypothetical protein